jgi:hypothetical protein
MDSTKPRLWLVIFSEADSPAWWARFLRSGFRHVYAVSYFADQERWVCVDPARNRLMVELFTAEQAPRVLARMMETAGAVLRVASRRDRLNAPAFGFCGGSMKALLGIRSWALTPRGLYRELLRRGAETVHMEAPCVAAPMEAAAPSRP